VQNGLHVVFSRRNFTHMTFPQQLKKKKTRKRTTHLSANQQDCEKS
jgi:hypothetical protein